MDPPLADRIFAVRDGSQAAYLAVWLGQRYGNRFGVDIHAPKIVTSLA